MKIKSEVIDKETLKLRIKLLIENNVFENKPNSETTVLLEKKCQTYV